MPQKLIIVELSRANDRLFSGARWARVIVNERGCDAVSSSYKFAAKPLIEFIDSISGVEERLKDKAKLELARHFVTKEETDE